MDVYLEAGKRRVFAGALEWPGWSRSGRDEQSALAILVEYGPRYRAALQGTVEVGGAGDVDEVTVAERLEGGAGTDFGAPSAIPDYDRIVPDAAELERMGRIMHACWEEFDRVTGRAAGVVLRPAGPRGGGRDLDKIRAHVVEADGAYLTSLGARASARLSWPDLRQAFIDALGARARGELPEVGPRGGLRWPARYAVRRAAWHVLDHAWEIEDRLVG